MASGSATAKTSARCDAILVNPSRRSEGYTGHGWAFNGSACVLAPALQLTQKRPGTVDTSGSERFT